MKTLYVIVHEHCIHIDLDIDKERIKPSEEFSRHSNVLTELERIKQEEDYVEVPKGPPERVDYEVPEDTLVRVCGAYGEKCVLDHIISLKRLGVPSEIYREGTVFIF